MYSNTLGGLLYILGHASESTNRDTLAAYAEQTDKTLTKYLLDLDPSKDIAEAAVLNLWQLIVLVRACEVLSEHAPVQTLIDMGRIMEKLAAQTDVSYPL